MRVSVIGTGYVGLVVGACLAKLGHEVYCVDIAPQRVKTINRGISPIYEDDLEEILKRVVKTTLSATTDLRKAIHHSTISFICVDTPLLKNGTLDLKNIKRSCQEIGQLLQRKIDHTLVIKASVLPGTTEKVLIPLVEKYSGRKAGVDFNVCVNPEFLREGTAVHDFLNPHRIIIGELDSKSGDILTSLYEDFNAPIIRTNLRTAEMIKYASNAFLATKLSFINEIGDMCKRLGIDVYEVTEGMGYDPRITHRYMKAGPGFGGSCLPTTTQALVSQAKKLGMESSLLKAVLKVNQKQPLRLVQMVRRKLGNLKGKRVGILGLAFKEGTDDVRGSQALPVIEKLLKGGAKVLVYDPKAIKNARKVLGRKVSYVRDAKTLVDRSDCVVVMTDWGEFKQRNLFRGKIVIDSRRILKEKERIGMDYEGIAW